ncbi:MAG: hypothetical protein J7J67_01465 [Thermoproteales archaeon]|nr:hypothetical protein [Thermoproteales archaeon]
MNDKQKFMEEKLYERISKKLRKREVPRKPVVEHVFTRKVLLTPRDVAITNYNRILLACFNPGALLEKGSLHVFPRTIFDYYNYVSSISFFKIEVEKVINENLEKPVSSRVILWPRNVWEFNGCEDPRVYKFNSKYLMLYTGYGFIESVKKPVQGFTELDENLNAGRRGFFSISVDGEMFIPKAMKDSAFIEVEGSRAWMLTRPTLKDVDVCWRGLADLSALTLDGETLEPVLFPEGWELKVGWSTNVVKLSSNEYIVGWHGIFKEDLSYRNGLAVVDREGNLLAVSNYLLAPEGLEEEYGDRPLVIFGDGLVKYKEYLMWIGGVSDYAIGVFAVELEKALEKVRWLTE